MARFSLSSLLRRARQEAPVPAAQAVGDREAALVELAAADAAVADAEAGYRSSLLSGDEDEMRARAQAQADAGLRRDRACAMVDAFDKQIAEAQAREAAAERARIEAEHQARYDAVRTQADEARKVLREAYPQLAADIVSVLRIVAETELAVQAANADLPAGAAPIDPIQASVRDLQGTPRTVLSETEVYRWCWPGEQFPDALDQSRVEVSGGRGFIRLPRSGARYLVRRKFVEQRVAERDPGATAYTLASKVSLPGLLATDPPIWSPLDSAQPTQVLASIASRSVRSAMQRSEPRIETKLVPVEAFDKAVELMAEGHSLKRAI